jgi:hypothetical protein
LIVSKNPFLLPVIFFTFLSFKWITSKQYDTLFVITVCKYFD